MTHTALKNRLVKAFAAVTVAGAMTGCATICDQQCQLEQSARAMTDSSDVGIRAMGVRTLEGLHPEVKAAGDAVRSMAIEQEVECNGSVEMHEGRKILKLSNCGNPAP